ncbi:MAG: zinc ribbon domain-containing protein [Ruminococcus sp.]|nr:zinc ribbon domain-containing protein [Ruminococcus sp.]
MSIVSDFGKKVSNKTKEISQKAKVMSETNSLNNIIKGEECKIDFQYKTIGKLYYEKYGENPSDEFKEAIETINASKEKIEETKQEITKIRSRFNCPNCGEAFKNDALFCSKCGAKLPEREEEKPKIPDGAQKCEKCGNILKKDALFCNVCGSKLNVPEPDNADAPQLPDSEFAPVENTQEAVIEVKQDEITEVPEIKAAEATVTEVKAEAPEKTEEIAKADTEEKAEETAEPEIDEETAEKICPACNNKMDADDLFCNECGTKVE